MNNKYKVLSLFGNVGIAETYLKKLNFETVVYNELLPQRAKFYNHFSPKTIQVVGDIQDEKIKKSIIENSKKENVDVVMATPPCQGFSVAGKRLEDDPRNRLIIETLEIIDAINPKYVFIENVPQYFTDTIKYNGKLIKIPDLIKEHFDNKYHFEMKVLDSKNYSVPQSRKRGFILLSRNDVSKWEFPQEHKKIVTVEEAIGHLPSLVPNVKGEDIQLNEPLKFHKAPTHNDRHILAMSHTPSGKTAHHNIEHYPKTVEGKKVKGFATTYKRMSWDKPAPTITMMNGSISSQNNVHPGRPLPDGTYSDPRVLTLREIFILSSLPEEWDVPSWASDTLIRHVVGEGIPPKLVYEIFKMIGNNDGQK